MKICGFYTNIYEKCQILLHVINHECRRRRPYRVSSRRVPLFIVLNVSVCIKTDVDHISNTSRWCDDSPLSFCPPFVTHMAHGTVQYTLKQCKQIFSLPALFYYFRLAPILISHLNAESLAVYFFLFRFFTMLFGCRFVERLPFAIVIHQIGIFVPCFRCIFCNVCVCRTHVILSLSMNNRRQCICTRACVRE